MHFTNVKSIFIHLDDEPRSEVVDLLELLHVCTSLELADVEPFTREPSSQSLGEVPEPNPNSSNRNSPEGPNVFEQLSIRTLYQKLCVAR